MKYLLRDTEFEDTFRLNLKMYADTDEEFESIRKAYDVFARAYMTTGRTAKDTKKIQSPYRKARKKILDLFNETGKLSILSALDDIDEAINSISHTQAHKKKILKNDTLKILQRIGYKEHKIKKIFSEFNNLVPSDPENVYNHIKRESDAPTKYEELVQRVGADINNPPSGKDLLDKIFMHELTKD